jgi:hypothetical protein
MKRVTELVLCPYYRGPEYDESRFNGHAVEAVLFEHLLKYGFQPQVEIRYRDIVGHVDFLREADSYIEILEVKNTASVKYSHLLQLALYKSIAGAVYNKPVVCHLVYVKFETVIGEAPVRPAWVPADWKYVHVDIDAGEHYINWGLFRAAWSSRIAGPYCATCQADCRIKYVVRRGQKEQAAQRAQ